MQRALVRLEPALLSFIVLPSPQCRKASFHSLLTKAYGGCTMAPRSMTGNSWLVRALIGDAPRVIRDC